MLIKVKGKKTNRPEDIHRILAEVLKMEDEFDRDKEHFWVFGLDSRNVVKYIDLVSLGSLTAAIVHPREVFCRAVTERVSTVVFAHNHPSDNLEASRDDLKLNERLIKCGDLLGIKVTDHVIVNQKGYMSFVESGLM